jgi:hypothetical protein
MDLEFAALHVMDIREAAYCGNMERVQNLVEEEGLDINQRNPINGWTALHWACLANNGPVMDYLIRKGADVNAVNDKGQKPFDLLKSDELKKIFASNLPSKEDSPDSTTISTSFSSMTSSPTPTHGQSTHGSAAAPTANTGGIKLNGIKPMANTVVPVSELKNDLNVRKKRRDQIDLSNQPMKPNNSTLSVNSFNSSDYPTQAKSISSGATVSTSPPTNSPVTTSSSNTTQSVVQKTIYQSDLLGVITVKRIGKKVGKAISIHSGDTLNTLLTRIRHAFNNEAIAHVLTKSMGDISDIDQVLHLYHNSATNGERIFRVATSDELNHEMTDS